MTRHHIVSEDALRHYANLNVGLGCVWGALFATLAIYVIAPIVARAFS